MATAADTIGEMFVRVAADDSPFNAGLARVHARSLQAVGQLGRLETRGVGLFRNIGLAAVQAGGMITRAFLTLGTAAFGGLIASLTAVAGLGVKLASDFGETYTKFGFLFTDTTKQSMAELDNFGKRVGRARTELYDMAANFKGITRGMGLSNEESSKLAVSLTRLAVDLGSFNNVADTEAAERLQSGLIGNHEALRRLNVFISEATIKTELLRMGFRGTFEEASDAQKQLARLSIVLRETAVAHDDADRTSDSFANRMKALWASTKEVGLEIGNALIPSLSIVVGAMIDLINIVGTNSATWQDWGQTLANVTGMIVAGIREAGAWIYNYDLLWRYLQITIAEVMINAQMRVLWFSQAGVAAFQWFTDNVHGILETMAYNATIAFTMMASTITSVFNEMWDYITSGGTDAMEAHMLDLTNLMKGFNTTDFTLPEFAGVNLDEQRKAVKDMLAERRRAMSERISAPPGGALGGAKLPDLQQNAKQKVQVELVSAEQVFRKTLLDSLKQSKETQLLQTNEAQLAELKATKAQQQQQHTELVGAVKFSSFGLF